MFTLATSNAGADAPAIEVGNIINPGPQATPEAAWRSIQPYLASIIKPGHEWKVAPEIKWQKNELGQEGWCAYASIVKAA